MSAMASQITGVLIVYSIIYPGAAQRKHQSSASLAFVMGIHRWPVNSPHKGPVTRKTFPFNDVIMVWASYCTVPVNSPPSHWTRGHLKEILDKYFKANSRDWWVRYPLWNCSHVNGTGTHWWIVKMGSGNGLVPSGNKSLILVNIDPDLCRHMASLGHNEIKLALPSQWPTFMITTSLKWLVRSTIDRREMNSLTATFYPSWWRHQMETFFSLLAGPLWGESTGHRWIPPTKQVTQSVDVLFDLRKRLSKQSRRQWFKTPLHSLWRHCKGYWFSALCIPVANINFNP